MDPEAAAITASKRIKLFGEMLASVGYPDVGVTQEVFDFSADSGWFA